jgi:ribosomal protein S18 acetylase RimI-like enzyme
MDESTSLAIFVRGRTLDHLLAWVLSVVGPARQADDVDGAPAYHPESGGAVVFQPGVEGGPFIEIFFSGAKWPWPTDVACGRAAAKALNCVVRCEPGDAYPECHPLSDGILEINGPSESIVLWGDESDELSTVAPDAPTSGVPGAGKGTGAGHRDPAVALAPATPADLPLLADYLRGLRADDPMPAGTAADDATALAAVAALLADPALGRAWLIRSKSSANAAGTGDTGVTGDARHAAEAADRPVGYAVLTFVHSIEFGGRCGFVDELYVEPAARGLGVGRRALALVTTAAADLGVRVLLLEVSPENERAAKLYAAAGFGPRKYKLMAKRLDRPAAT